MDNDNKNDNTISNNDYEITCFEHDSFYKKLYLGDSFGRIKSFYLSTGDLIKQFESHKKEITHIIYSAKYDYLITSSTDLKVKFHKDKEQTDNNYKIIREIELIPEKKKKNIEIKKVFLKKFIFDEEKGLLISCLSNGLIIELDIEHFKTINVLETVLDFIQVNNMKVLPQITSAEYIEDVNMFFIALDNKIKALITLKNSQFFNLLKGQYIGNFLDKNDINNSEDYNFKKYIIMYGLYDSKSKRLFLVDSFGFLICYNLSSLFDKLINNKMILNKEIKNFVKNDITFPIIFKIQLNKETITFIFKPKELIPNVLIVSSANRMVKLINYETGKFLDSLKQISILDSPFPIAIRYNIDNPFEKRHYQNYQVLKIEGNKEWNEVKEQENKTKKKAQDNSNNHQYLMTEFNIFNEEEKINNKFYQNIIYRKDVVFYLEPLKFKKNKDRQEELIRYSNDVLIYTVKETLRIPKYGKEIPVDKSTLWYYEIDIEHLKKINDENISIISRKVGKKEKERNITENNFQQYSINTKNYLPKYVKDLDQNEKDKMKESINQKIKDVNLAFNKREKVKQEMNGISKIDKKNKFNESINNVDNLFSNKNKNDGNFFLTPVKPKNIISFINKKKKGENRLPLIDKIPNNNLNREKIDKKGQIINKNKSYIKLNNIKIVHRPNKYHFRGNIFKNVSITKDDKFNEFKNEFDEKYNEIMGPIEFIKLRKKK